MTTTPREPRRYDEAPCSWCEGDEKNAHVFVVGLRISPACPEHARQYVIDAHL